MTIYKVEDKYYTSQKLTNDAVLRSSDSYFESYEYSGTLDGPGPYSIDELDGELKKKDRMIVSISADDENLFWWIKLKQKREKKTNKKEK
ncbi:MAG: hypothetical protein IKS98_13255 [Lachnospiraceae bacterium]|nr:hypothetical protein [Lachnospiraceae bacterium]